MEELAVINSVQDALVREIDIDKIYKRVDALLDRVEKLIPGRPEISTDPGYCAYRWSANGLEGISQFDQVDKSELLHLERQTERPCPRRRGV